MKGSSSGGNGSSVPGVGRGATRGRRDRAKEMFLKTRPETLTTKQGTAGNPLAAEAVPGRHEARNRSYWSQESPPEAS